MHQQQVLGQASLVNPKMSTNVLREKNLLFRGVPHLPFLETADVLLILTCKKVAISTIHLTDCLNAQDCGLDALLKKRHKLLRELCSLKCY